MAIYRNVQMTFWTDAEMVDGFTPEDRYFYLYLLTNPHTNLAGCYEISLKQISDETGYTKETIEKLIDRMEKVHHKIVFSPETKEILVVNWYKYNWTGSEKFQKPLKNEIEKIKNDGFKTYVAAILSGDSDTVSIPYRYPIDTTVTVYNNTPFNFNNKKEHYIDDIKEILEYLNHKTGKRYSTRGKANVDHVKARLKEGFTVSEFKEVIDRKCDAWLNDGKMCAYLRPETLFCAKHFESYLNEIENEATRRRKEAAEIDAKQRASYTEEYNPFT